MSSRIVKILVSTTIVSALTGCGVSYGGVRKTTATDNVTQGNPTEKQISDSQLRLSEKVLSGEWNIYKVNGKVIGGDEDDMPYINFSIDEDRFYAYDGCNVINGDFKAQIGQLIEFQNMLSTLRECLDMSNEYDINQALGSVRSYSLEKHGQEYYLNLHDKSHLTVLTLRKHNLEFLNGAWQVVKVNDKSYPDSDMQLLIDIEEHKIHGNTGCNVLNGVLVEDPYKEASIQFQNIVTTRAACSDAAMETSLLIALEEVETAKRGSNKTVSLLDKHGSQVLLLAPLTLQ